jgi:hypothetical protein
MGYFRRVLVAVFGAISLVGAGSLSVAAHDRGTLVEFDSMSPVTGAAVGTVNDRGIKGGGLPWVIKSGRGEVDRQGEVEVRVRGLIITVPPVNGVNPVPFFRATVSCLTNEGVVNVSTGLVAASSAGNSTIEAKVTLPHPCRSPEVFVVSPGGAWFAQSRSDRDDED